MMNEQFPVPEKRAEPVRDSDTNHEKERAQEELVSAIHSFEDKERSRKRLDEALKNFRRVSGSEIPEEVREKVRRRLRDNLIISHGFQAAWELTEQFDIADDKDFFTSPEIQALVQKKIRSGVLHRSRAELEKWISSFGLSAEVFDSSEVKEGILKQINWCIRSGKKEHFSTLKRLLSEYQVENSESIAEAYVLGEISHRAQMGRGLHSREMTEYYQTILELFHVSDSFFENQELQEGIEYAIKETLKLPYVQYSFEGEGRGRRKVYKEEDLERARREVRLIQEVFHVSDEAIQRLMDQSEVFQYQGK